jgi:hypothetical protein
LHHYTVSFVIVVFSFCPVVWGKGKKRHKKHPARKKLIFSFINYLSAGGYKKKTLSLRWHYPDQVKGYNLSRNGTPKNY